MARDKGRGAPNFIEVSPLALMDKNIALINCGCGIMVERDVANVEMRVRFSPPAQHKMKGYNMKATASVKKAIELSQKALLTSRREDFLDIIHEYNKIVKDISKALFDKTDELSVLHEDFQRYIALTKTIEAQLEAQHLIRLEDAKREEYFRGINTMRFRYGIM